MLQAEEITNLRAGNQNSDSVGEADDNGAGKIFDGGAHARNAEKNEENAGHHGAHRIGRRCRAWQ